MQLRLTIDEMNLLADVLLAQISSVADQVCSSDGVNPGPKAEQRSQQYRTLLDKVFARDLKFDSDELEMIEDVLRMQRSRTKNAMAPQPSAAASGELVVLESALQKVEEACAMI